MKNSKKNLKNKKEIILIVTEIIISIIVLSSTIASNFYSDKKSTEIQSYITKAIGVVYFRQDIHDNLLITIGAQDIGYHTQNQNLSLNASSNRLKYLNTAIEEKGIILPTLISDLNKKNTEIRRYDKIFKIFFLFVYSGNIYSFSFIYFHIAYYNKKIKNYFINTFLQKLIQSRLFYF